MLATEKTVFILIDVQGKLAQLMHNKEDLFENLQKVIKGLTILGVPVVWAEQIPKNLGPTLPEIAQLLPDLEPVAKTSFSCCGNNTILQKLRQLNRNQVLLAGIETHVCVYQTALDLINSSYEVQVIADAVSSRTQENKKIGLDRIERAGGLITSTEMALFELLGSADAPKFKEIIKIVK
jgi:nicotinamidase-related amidase